MFRYFSEDDHPDNNSGMINDGAVVKVGKGRGFVVASAREREPGRFVEERFIITAAHCLPKLPPIFPDREDYTYKSLVGRLTERGRKTRVWAECLVADAMADIAVFGGPDDQALYSEAERYQTFIEDDEEIVPFLVSDSPLRGRGSLLSLDGRWFGCSVERRSNGPLWISDTQEPIVGGMSGSPILAADGTAIGVVSTSSGSGDDDDHREGQAPAIMRDLPAWLVRQFAAAKHVIPSTAPRQVSE